MGFGRVASAEVPSVRGRARKVRIEYCWTAAAMYNIARVEEETGEYEKAIDDYQSADRQNPSYIGAALRAQWVKELK